MKEKIREKVLQRLKSLTNAEKVEKSKVIIEKLKKIPEFAKCERICIYVSTENEVYTHDLIKELLGSKKILVPYMDGEIKVSSLSSFSDLSLGTHGILEPKSKKEYDGKVDLILVPGVAFDRNLNRIGRGKGHYDIYLEKAKGLKIALAFSEQIVESIPTESHDISMDKIITDERII